MLHKQPMINLKYTLSKIKTVVPKLFDQWPLRRGDVFQLSAVPETFILLASKKVLFK